MGKVDKDLPYVSALSKCRTLEILVRDMIFDETVRSALHAVLFVYVLSPRTRFHVREKITSSISPIS